MTVNNQPITSKSKIWYASYGSNLLEERFHCYIRGGQPNGSSKMYSGCTNKSLPTDNKPISIHHELYFANKSKSWNGSGVGFIKTEFDESKITLGRMYLITIEQFIEVVKQENNIDGDIAIDFNHAQKFGSVVFKDKSWYGNLLYLGQDVGYPIFTFTHQRNLTDKLNPPNSEYLSMIIRGLKETYNMSDLEIQTYLSQL